MFPSLWLKQITENNAFLKSLNLVFSIAFYCTAFILVFLNKNLQAPLENYFTQNFTHNVTHLY
jgi:hypothetical protein